MQQFKGLLQEIEIAYVPTQVHRAKVVDSISGYELLIRHYNKNTINYTEQAVALFLNRANNTVGISTISTGGMSGCVIDGKVLFLKALKCGASAIILSHNHPSGQLKPSQSDIKLTQDLTKFGKLIDISILDHLIIGEESYLSMKDEDFM